jgi:hypothetical protein
MSGKCDSCSSELHETDIRCPECGLEVLCCTICGELFTIDNSGLEICTSCLNESINRPGGNDDSEDFKD